jgi:hypothetical protein
MARIGPEVRRRAAELVRIGLMHLEKRDVALFGNYDGVDKS